MSKVNWLEMFGFFAILVLVLSFQIKAMIWQRWISVMGYFLVAAYAMMMEATPIVVLNFYFVGITLIQLWRIYTEPVHFQLVSSSVTDVYLQQFIAQYREQIDALFPEFHLEGDRDYIAVMIYRDVFQAGIFICHRTETEGTAEVDIDFVLPSYREMGASRFLFHRNANFFRDQGIARLVAKSWHDRHHSYLQETGFVPTTNDQMVFVVPTSPNI